MRFLIGLLKVLEGLILFYLLFIFLKWYVKGHFGKYFIFFWAWTIFSFFVYQSESKRINEKYASDPRSGYEIWQENMKGYDAVRGY
jgi:hypothetical protein